MSAKDLLMDNESFILLCYSGECKQVTGLLRTASREQIQVLRDIGRNILKHNVPLSAKQVSALRRPDCRELVYMLADPRLSWLKVRDNLVKSHKQRGGFPPLLALLAPLILPLIKSAAVGAAAYAGQKIGQKVLGK
jgi:hypothetical protein